MLRLLAGGTVHTFAQLAAELSLDQALVKQMLLDLERAGYVQTITGCAEGQCRSCDLQGLCALGQQQRVWIVTEKSSRAARAR